MLHLLQPSTTVSFADVAHGTLIFDHTEEPEQLVLELLDTRWVQRLRSVSQTGNTKLVYMFAEHSRFGHSLGVAYLATMLMKHLRIHTPDLVKPFQNAVAAAALLHDIGHVAPGSHLAERIWAPDLGGQHEDISVKILREDPEISAVLKKFGEELPEQVAKILLEDPSMPPWTSAIISGGGWNADRGNWAIVDSAMCAVSYGRYNVSALIDAFRLTLNGEMVLHESRLDALTHFFVARDSMYRQVYQHRVLQAVDALTQRIVCRVKDILQSAQSDKEVGATLHAHKIFSDHTMQQVLTAKNYAEELPLESISRMTESWWQYHIESWCDSGDAVLSDLSRRYRDRALFKTIRLQTPTESDRAAMENTQAVIESVKKTAQEMGYDPRYYVMLVEDADAHRGKSEQATGVLLDSGEIVSVTEAEPMIGQLLRRPQRKRRWLAVPKEVKARLGFYR